MKKISLNLRVSAILFLVYVGTFIIDFFTVKAITLSSFALCVGALIAYTLFLSRLKPLYYLGILTFTFFAQYLGAMMGLYLVFPPYDFVLHLLSGSLLVFLADYVLELVTKKHEDKNIPHVLRIMFCGITSVASAAVWEIWEFSGDKLLGLTSQLNSLDDTMSDILAGSTGAVIGVLLLMFILNKQKATKKQ